MNRTPEDQSLHDEKVSQTAAGYQAQGYELVHLRKINGHIPDLIAEKRVEHNGRWITETVIVEIETETSIDTAHAQAQKQAFQKAAATDPYTTFEVCVA